VKGLFGTELYAPTMRVFAEQLLRRPKIHICERAIAHDSANYTSATPATGMVDLLDVLVTWYFRGGRGEEAERGRGPADT